MSAALDMDRAGEDGPGGHGPAIVIARAGRPVARLVALAEPARPRVPGGWRGKVSMAADFDGLPDEIEAAFVARCHR